MKGNQVFILVIVAAVSAAGAWWYLQRAEKNRVAGVTLDNFNAVAHFEKYGGGF